MTASLLLLACMRNRLPCVDERGRWKEAGEVE